MLPKCVETIDRLPHEGKDIVRSSGKLETRVHHRDRHRLSNFAESAASDRGRCDNYRSRDVRRAQGLTPGIARDSNAGRRLWGKHLQGLLPYMEYRVVGTG